MKSAIVTGAKGWLGSRLVTHLSEGLPDYPQPDPYRVVGTDKDHLNLLDRTGVKDFFQAHPGAVVFHTAGMIHPPKVADFYKVNVEATRNVLEAARESNASRVVVVSSNSVCGCNPHPDHLFDEDSPYRPYMNYGKSKMQMEQLVKESGLEYVLIRAPWFYGPNQPPRQTTFFQMIKKGMFPIVGSGQNMRSMAYVDNLCHGLQCAAETPGAAHQIYWIADSRPYSMNEIVETVGEALRSHGHTVKPNRFKVPWIIGEFATWADFVIQSAGLYHQKIHVLSEMNKSIACTTERAEKELGYTPKISLFEGMSRSLQWLKENGLEV